MKRRDFIVGLGGAAAWPLAVRAQQPDRVRRVGIVMGIPESDPEAQPRITAFRRGLEEFGWTEGKNVELVYRWAGADIRQIERFAKEIVELRPEVILCHNTRPVAALLRETRTTPIVFVAVADPVGSGFVASMSRPEGNVTGFTNHESSLAGKWLELLKEIAPRVSRVALLFNPETAPQAGAFFSGPFETAAPTFAIQPVAMPVRSAAEVEPALAALAHQANTGLVVMADTFTAVHRDLIVAAVAKHRVPAAYPWPYFTLSGGLVAYGPDQVDMFRRAIIRRPHPARCAAGGASGPGSYQISIVHQPQDRQGARPRGATDAARPRRRGDRVNRRTFIGLLGGAAAWPLVARAQQSERVRRIAILRNTDENDPETQHRLAGFRRGLNALGWIEGRNIEIEFRSGRGNDESARSHARELALSGAEVILTNSTPATAAIKQATSSIPIVFTMVSDPVGDGLVDSLSRPGRNITGFASFESEIGGKWIELLREAVPGVERAALLFNPRTVPGGGTRLMRPYFDDAARALGIEPVPMPVESAGDIDRALRAHAARGRAGLVGMPDSFLFVNGPRLIELVSELRLPAIFPFRRFAELGALMTYGVDSGDRNLRAAAYVDRILKGERPADLPVQAPTQYELVINMKTTKALGIDLPPTLLARADEVIE